MSLVRLQIDNFFLYYYKKVILKYISVEEIQQFKYLRSTLIINKRYLKEIIQKLNMTKRHLY